jgi:hypothetical protein
MSGDGIDALRGLVLGFELRREADGWVFKNPIPPDGPVPTRVVDELLDDGLIAVALDSGLATITTAGCDLIRTIDKRTRTALAEWIAQSREPKCRSTMKTETEA